MGAREKTLQILTGHSKTAMFPPSQNAPPPPGGPSKRNIPSTHDYDPKSLKAMSKALFACSTALGHTLTAYRQLNRLKSATVSPDGMLGGRGYVISVRNMRQKLFEACESLSSIADTIHDEIGAPHWQPKLALLDDNDQEDVERFVEESEEILENPEGEAHEKIEEIEEANDGKKSKKNKKKDAEDEERGSEMPGGGAAEDSEAEPVRVKSAGERVAHRFLKTADSSLPGGGSVPRVTERGPATGDGPWGSFNEDESPPADDWSADEGVSRRDEGGEDYDFPGEHENEWPKTALDDEAEEWAKEAMHFQSQPALKQYLRKHPKADPSKHTVSKPSKEDQAKRVEEGEKRVEQEKAKKEKAKADDAKSKAEWKKKQEGKPKAKGSPWGPNPKRKPKDEKPKDEKPKDEPKKEEKPKKKNWLQKLLKKGDDAEAWAESIMPDESQDDTPTEGWDFGLGFGAKGQGAGGYENPSNEGGGKGVWGPQSGLPGSPSQSSGDTTPITEEALNDHKAGFESADDVDAWLESKADEHGSMLKFQASDEYREAYPEIAKVYAGSRTPGDVAGPPARADYFDGPKDNLVQAESEAWAESVMPGDGTGAPTDYARPGVSDTAYVHEDHATPYVRWDSTMRDTGPEDQQGRVDDDEPFAQGGDSTR
jgi:hypothetical protein